MPQLYKTMNDAIALTEVLLTKHVQPCNGSFNFSSGDTPTGTRNPRNIAWNLFEATEVVISSYSFGGEHRPGFSYTNYIFACVCCVSVCLFSECARMCVCVCVMCMWKRVSVEVCVYVWRI